MSVCGDNPALDLVGCGQSYGGEMQHSVARVPWSQHSDGRAHVTATLSLIERCWMKGRDQMADPALLGFSQDDRGVWRWPTTDGRRADIASMQADRRVAVRVSDETGENGS